MSNTGRLSDERHVSVESCGDCAKGVCFEHDTRSCASCHGGFNPDELVKCSCGTRNCYDCTELGGCGNPQCDRLARGE